MKTLKILAVGLFVLSTTISFAQKKKSPEERAQMLTDKMKSELALTDAQTERVAQINLGIAMKNHAIRTNESMDIEAKKLAAKENRKASVQMLKDVLTVSQFEKMKKLKKERRAHKIIKKEKGSYIDPFFLVLFY